MTRTYVQRYGNRAVKARVEVEADSTEEARRKAQAWLDLEHECGGLWDDVRLIGQPTLKATESTTEGAG